MGMGSGLGLGLRLGGLGFGLGCPGSPVVVQRAREDVPGWRGRYGGDMREMQERYTRGRAWVGGARCWGRRVAGRSLAAARVRVRAASGDGPEWVPVRRRARVARGLGCVRLCLSAWLAPALWGARVCGLGRCTPAHRAAAMCARVKARRVTGEAVPWNRAAPATPEAVRGTVQLEGPSAVDPHGAGLRSGQLGAALPPQAESGVSCDQRAAHEDRQGGEQRQHQDLEELHPPSSQHTVRGACSLASSPGPKDP